MRDAQAADAEPVLEQVSAPTDRRQTARRIGAITVVALLVGGLIWFLHWWAHPSLFDPPGNAVGYNRATVGLPVDIGITFPGDPAGVDQVTIETISPNIAKNTSHSKITLSVCNEGAAVIGVAKGSPERLCTEVRPATDVPSHRTSTSS